MAKKKPTPGDRHKAPQINLRLPPKLYQALEAYVASLEGERTHEIRNAIRIYLASKGFWPLQPDQKE